MSLKEDLFYRNSNVAEWPVSWNWCSKVFLLEPTSMSCIICTRNSFRSSWKIWILGYSVRSVNLMYFQFPIKLIRIMCITTKTEIRWPILFYEGRWMGSFSFSICPTVDRLTPAGRVVSWKMNLHNILAWLNNTNLCLLLQLWIQCTKAWILKYCIFLPPNWSSHTDSCTWVSKDIFYN